MSSDDRRTPPSGEGAARPHDYDDPRPPSEDELASYVELDVEEPALSEGDDAPSVESEVELAAELIEADEGSWMDSGQDEAVGDIGVDLTDDEEGWSEAGADSELEPGDDWFGDGYDDPHEEDDRGEEGPIEEHLEIDRAGWDELGPDTEDAEEEIEDALERLGIALPGASEEPRAELQVGAELLLETSELGPSRGRITAVATRGGALVAVGEGLFLLGADGMLHRAAGSGVLERLRPASVCHAEEELLVGTELGGALRLDTRCERVVPINGWMEAQGTRDASRPRNEPGSLTVIAGASGTGVPPVLGHTGRGEVFCSEDAGASWRGPLIDGRCLAIATVAGSSRTVALVERDRRITLDESDDLSRWSSRPIPDWLRRGVAQRPAQLRSAAETVVVAVDDPETPLACSLDRGDTWRPAEAMKGVTAVAVDPDDPGWLAAAVHQAVRDRGIVRVSADGGSSWKTVLIAGDSASEEALRGPGDDEPGSRVSELLVIEGRNRRLVAVTPRGVYEVVLARPGSAH